MNHWIIERQMVGRLSSEDWKCVAQRVRRIRRRFLKSRTRPRVAKTRVFVCLLFGFMLLVLFWASGDWITAAPVSATTFAGLVMTMWQRPEHYLRAVRRQRLQSLHIPLRSSTSFAQLLRVFALRSLGARVFILGVAFAIAIVAPSRVITSLLGPNPWMGSAPLLFALCAILVLAVPLLPFSRLWQTESFKNLVRARRTEPESQGRPPCCLACAHSTLVGPHERCTECGYPNKLPAGL